MKERPGLAVLLFGLFALGCSDPAALCTAGELGCDCRADATCNAGLTCTTDLCVSAGAPSSGGSGVSVTSSGGTGGGSTGGTGGSGVPAAGGTGASGVIDSGTTDGGAIDSGTTDGGAPDGGALDGGKQVDPALLTAGCGVDNPPVSGDYKILSSAVQRDYILYVPPDYDPSHPYNLIFFFHGLSVEPKQIAYDWNWNGFSPFAGDSTIMVAPRGQGNPIGWGSGMTDNAKVLVQDLVNYLSATYCIHKGHIFATGPSSGGFESNGVGCLMGDVFRAIAPIMGGGPSGTCKGPVAAWITHGSADNNVNVSYGRASRDYWRTANGCSSNVVSYAIGSGDWAANCDEYQDCKAGYPVVWCLSSRGHEHPPWAAEQSWKFFSRFID